MSSCKFPEHHISPGRTYLFVTAVLAAAVGYHFRVVVLQVLAIFAIVTGLLLTGAMVYCVMVLIARARRHGQIPGNVSLSLALSQKTTGASVAGPKRLAVPSWLRHSHRALWAAVRWHHLTRNLVLAYPDKHRQGKVRRPRAVILPTRHGIVAWARTVPGCGRKEFDADAQHIADYWHCQRVSISQPRPGRLRIAGHVRDPLLEPFGIDQAPAAAYTGKDLTRAYVGRDEHGSHRWMQVKDNTAATVAGQPGSGKSVAVNGLLLQWAPSPACQFGTADGKSPVDGGDYEVWRPRAWRTCSDSREDTADMLSDACAVMRARLGCVAEVTGSRNAWHRGPTEDFPLFGIVLDECQRYLDVTVARRDKELEKLILQIQGMAGDLVRQGRSVLMFLILATQRATVDSIPGQIRDNAALSLALSQKTTDASVAALGSQIRDYPSFAPTAMQGPEYTGCAVASMRTGQDPYTRLRFPGATYADLKACADATAHLRRDPGALLPVTVPDDASQLAAVSQLGGGS